MVLRNRRERTDEEVDTEGERMQQAVAEGVATYNFYAEVTLQEIYVRGGVVVVIEDDSGDRATFWGQEGGQWYQPNLRFRLLWTFRDPTHVKAYRGVSSEMAFILKWGDEVQKLQVWAMTLSCGIEDLRKRETVIHSTKEGEQPSDMMKTDEAHAEA